MVLWKGDDITGKVCSWISYVAASVLTGQKVWQMIKVRSVICDLLYDGSATVSAGYLTHPHACRFRQGVATSWQSGYQQSSCWFATCMLLQWLCYADALGSAVSLCSFTSCVNCMRCIQGSQDDLEVTDPMLFICVLFNVINVWLLVVSCETIWSYVWHVVSLSWEGLWLCYVPGYLACVSGYSLLNRKYSVWWYVIWLYAGSTWQMSVTIVYWSRNVGHAWYVIMSSAGCSWQVSVTTVYWSGNTRHASYHMWLPWKVYNFSCSPKLAGRVIICYVDADFTVPDLQASFTYKNVCV